MFVVSVRDVEKFLDLVKTDEKFKQNIIKTIKALQIKEGKSFNEDRLIKNVIIPLAQKKGINFTEKDFLNYADKKTLKLREEDFPMVSGGIGRTSKAKLLLGVTLLGTSTAAAMNLAQLRHEEPTSSIKESSQNESSENNSHSKRNQTISQDNLPNTVSGVLNLEPGAVNVGSNNATSNKAKSPAANPAVTSLASAPVASQLDQKTEESAKATTKSTDEYADNDIPKNVQPTEAANLNAAKVDPKNNVAPIASILTDISATDKIETNDVVPTDADASEVLSSTAAEKPDTEGAELKEDNIGTTVSTASEVTVWETLKNTGKNVVNLASYLNPLNIFKGKSSSNFDLTSSEYEEERAIIKEHGGVYKSVQGNCGAEDNKDGVKYTLCNDGCLFIFGKGPMASFFPKVFAPWHSYAAQIKKVVIAKGVTSIGDGAFYGCSKLTEAIIPDSVTAIGKSMFSGCSNLTQITIPSSVESIGDWAFGNCSNLTQITIPDSVTSIGYATFSGCSSLSQTTIPSSVKSIGDYAFHGCSKLTEAIIPDSVTAIGKGMFSGCSNLTQITIPSSVESIGDWAFKNCSKLTEFIIPGSVMSIGYATFSGCSSLAQITIPSSVKSIGDWAFENCSKLTEGTIPDSGTTIGRGMFSGCSSLTQITIPNSVKSIGDWAFYGCSNLTGFTIPDSVKSIGCGALGNCAQLKNVNCYAQSDASFKDVFKLKKIKEKKTKTKVSAVYVTKGYKGNRFGGVAVTKQLKAEDDLEALISGLKNLDKGEDGLPNLDNEVGEKYKNRIKIAANSINEKGKIEGTHFENAENASDDDIDMLLSLYYKITENKNDIWKNISPDKNSFMYYLKNVIEKKDVVIEDRRISSFLFNFINDIGPKIVDDEGTLYSTDDQVLFDLGAQNDNDELKMLLNIYYVIYFLSNLPKDNGVPDLNKADPKLVKYFTPAINLLGEQIIKDENNQYTFINGVLSKKGFKQEDLELLYKTRENLPQEQKTSLIKILEELPKTKDNLPDLDEADSSIWYWLKLAVLNLAEQIEHKGKSYNCADNTVRERFGLNDDNMKMIKTLAEKYKKTKFYSELLGYLMLGGFFVFGGVASFYMVDSIVDSIVEPMVKLIADSITGLPLWNFNGSLFR